MGRKSPFIPEPKEEEIKRKFEEISETVEGLDRQIEEISKIRRDLNRQIKEIKNLIYQATMVVK